MPWLADAADSAPDIPPRAMPTPALGTRLRVDGLRGAWVPPDMAAMPPAKRKPRTRAEARAPAQGRARRPSAAALDARLDLALVGTFPASDPIAIGRSTATEPPARPVERAPVAIDVEGIERARRQPQRPPDS